MYESTSLAVVSLALYSVCVAAVTRVCSWVRLNETPSLLTSRKGVLHQRSGRVHALNKHPCE
ncbi:hypothetical protein J6590_084403 [Homalodisca vitripennis]|nr:hypothetical protein J6590_084403 [Homalodisca vitripennis]